MGSLARDRQIVQFADYILDLQTAELRRDGTKILLQDQPFKILVTLIESPGRLVTREDLIRRIWSSGTFVDFDQSLNRAVGRLREALGDDAEHPRFIETIPRRGYRFIAPLNVRTENCESLSGSIDEVNIGPQGDLQQVGERTALTRHANLAWVKIAFAALAGFILIISMFFNRTARISTATTHSATIHSVAVLPLENISGDPSQDYFAEGMTDQLITDLGQISSLRVISRTSSMQYRGVHKPLPQIAGALNVDAVVEGTVLRSGDRVRITAQLIEANADRHLWAQTYEGEVGKVLGLQREIASAIATQVSATLAPHDQIRIGVERPTSPEVYESYLKGEYYLNRFTPDSISKAADYFQQAIRKDSYYAPAYTKLAGAYLMLGNMGVMSKKESLGKATPLIDNALRIDPSFAAAHAVRGWSRLQYDLDFDGAGVEFKRAVELNPNSVEARQGLGEYYLIIGQLQPAVQETERARELDPLALIVNAALCRTLLYARRYDDALAQCKANLELDPENLGALADVARVYAAKGMDAEAASTFMLLFKKAGYTPARLNALQIEANKAELKGLFRIWLRQERPDFTNPAGNPMIAAEAYVYAQDNDAALAWLERAVKVRCFGVTYLGVDPIFDGLRSDPRFMSLLNQIGLASVHP